MGNPGILIKIIKYLRLFSLDIIAGAISGTMFFSYIFNVHIPIYWYISLALSMLVIYLTDHILDSIRFAGSKYFFYKNYRKEILLFILLAGLLNVTLIFTRFPDTLLMKSLYPGLAMIIYFVVNHILKIKVLKELLIAAIYMIVLIFFPVFYLHEQLDTRTLFIIISYFLLVLSNVFMFTYEERRNKIYKYFTILFLFLSVSINIMMIATTQNLDLIFIIPVIMALILFITLTKFRNTKYDYYFAFITDGVFVLPFFIVYCG